MLISILFYSLFTLTLADISIISVDKNFTVASNTPDPQEKRLVIGVLLPKDISNIESLEYHNRLDTVTPGLILATESMREWLPGWNYTILLGDTNCNSIQGPLTAVQMYNKYKPDVFVGPVCPYVLAPVARYAGYWDIPVLSTGGMEIAFRKKTEQYSHLTCLGGTYQQFAEFFRHLLEVYSWKHVMFLYDSYSANSGKGRSMCEFTLGQAFSELGGIQNENISNLPFDAETANRTLYQDILEKSALKARIIILCAPVSNVREILLTASALGMTDKGEYVFFNVDLFSSVSKATPWYSSEATAEENNLASQAFQAVLTITSKTVEDFEFANFRARMRGAVEKLENPATNITVSTYVASYHDALVLYSRALNQTIQATGSISSRRDGSAVTKKIWDTSIKGVTGNVSIDKNGDRRADFSLLDLEPNSQTFRVVRVYRGTTNTFETIGEIHWPGRDGPPQDIPSCGFDGSLCEPVSAPILPILLAVSFGLIISLLAVSVFTYKHYKEEADIASMTWKIDIQDILSNNRQPGQKRSSLISMTSTESNQEHRGQVYVRTGYYKGTVVALKRISADKITLNRRLLLDLKKMKDLQYDHLVRFVGACIDPYQPMLITEYCPRGSLQDILEEEEMDLDWDFRFSLINDIIKGLGFLHSNEIGTHGNLKSSNCVVDSRFVLKLTDFGLHELRQIDDSVSPNSYQCWKSKLWTAPELLKSSQSNIGGTQKGDIYSFAIILHEIAARNGTWGLADSFLEPREIINKLIHSDGEFRPDIEKLVIDEELKVLITRCWCEEALDRPDINIIKTYLKKLNPQKSSNILDNLLSRMEIYANNLESLVEERTANYLEEKRKCEDLLYELLPKPVARNLIEGGDKKVIAETYAACTIYFSDIVGFTSLSAESTPLEIVYFLNDLYTLFDSIIQQEQFKDFICVGLPEPNGNKHASEIAKMSLRILEEVKKFTIRHKPEVKLQLRIGLHTEIISTYFYNIYCLFGDTVNTASRMESNGLPLRIHLSSSTAELLTEFGIFHLEDRGEMQIKGKGLMRTYWLNGVTNSGEDTLNQEVKHRSVGGLEKFERKMAGSIKVQKNKKAAARQSLLLED
ncbi:atrial natriuretic peptide receptor 1 [Eurytemora carolleeae]|uniref:atrial natriuretic peptide receptor 1 n=1 Tax=Eurytemora carolleeae TaxID=1294199 RepID=UPI000C75A0A1|nr:atrial natriuretic peptide receptor 1 [Eurytemora carolleeae]|eukprot:XP_023334377.1 atrial natriuretic peptide receptor 1-like [Eurytemora affinis]